MGAKVKPYSRPNQLAKMFSEILPPNIESGRSFKEVIELCEDKANESSKKRAVDLVTALVHLMSEVGRFPALSDKHKLLKLLMQLEVGAYADLESYLTFAEMQAEKSGFLSPLALAYLGVIFAYPKEMDKFTLEFVSDHHIRGIDMMARLETFQELNTVTPKTLEAMGQIKKDFKQKDKQLEFTREHLRAKQGGRTVSARKDSCLIAIALTSWQATGNWRAGIRYFENIVQRLAPTIAERELEEKEIDRKMKRISGWFNLPLPNPQKNRS